jgi:hypothetical protein
MPRWAGARRTGPWRQRPRPRPVRPVRPGRRQIRRACRTRPARRTHRARLRTRAATRPSRRRRWGGRGGRHQLHAHRVPGSALCKPSTTTRSPGGEPLPHHVLAIDERAQRHRRTSTGPGRPPRAPGSGPAAPAPRARAEQRRDLPEKHAHLGNIPGAAAPGDWEEQLHLEGAGGGVDGAADDELADLGGEGAAVGEEELEVVVVGEARLLARRGRGRRRGTALATLRWRGWGRAWRRSSTWPGPTRLPTPDPAIPARPWMGERPRSTAGRAGRRRGPPWRS